MEKSHITANKKNKVIFGTVIFPAAIKFAREFLNSLNAQTINDFDILIVLDSLEPAEVQRIVDEYPELAERVYLSPRYDGLKPYELRIEMLRLAKKKSYDLLVIGDIDDKFSENRVERYVAEYQTTYAFYYNDLVEWETGKKCMPSWPESTSDFRDLAQSNFMGMSLAAINLNALTDGFIDSLKDGDTPIFDWYLFTRLLMDVGPGCHIDGAKTYYRIYDGNIAGMAGVTVEDVRKEVNVKLKHYELLQKYDPLYGELLEKYRAIDPEQVDLSSLDANSYWWGLLRL